MEQGLQLEQKMTLRQRMLAQMARQSELLELSAIEFEQQVKKEAEENPAIELQEQENSPDDDAAIVKMWYERGDFQQKHMGSNADSAAQQAQIPDRDAAIQNDILQQITLRTMSERERQICIYLVGMLDDDGYIRRPLESIRDDVLFTYSTDTAMEEWNAALEIIQQAEPAGIGARNIKECLLLQLRRKNNVNDGIKTAINVLENYFDEFVSKKYAAIIKKMDITNAVFDSAIEEIHKLNPKPGAILSDNGTNSADVVIPDFVVEEKYGSFEIILAQRHLPKLSISKYYSKIAANSSDDAKKFASHKTNEAAWFIKSVQQRAITLEAVMKTIVSHQKTFFLTGEDADLRPLRQIDVAQRTGLDKSTISRAINNKYVQTNFGIYALEHFFVKEMESTNDNVLSVVQLKNAIAEVIEGEDKKNPLSDEEISVKLGKMGFKISRRTIVKYREEMGIGTKWVRRDIKTA